MKKTKLSKSDLILINGAIDIAMSDYADETSCSKHYQKLNKLREKILSLYGELERKEIKREEKLKSES